MPTPPGRPITDGPIKSLIRGILPARLKAARLGVTRLGFVPVEDQTNDMDPTWYKNWRDYKSQDAVEPEANTVYPQEFQAAGRLPSTLLTLTAAFYRRT